MRTDSQSPAAVTPKKRDPVISCLKGLGMVFIVLIHLVDWSNMHLPPLAVRMKELLYVGPLWFIALSGTVVAIAYGRKPLSVATGRLWYRGVQLVAIYYVYNIAKLFLFDFSTEPFYGLPEKSWATVVRILTFQTFTIPITIILSIGAFLLVAPLFLWLSSTPSHSREGGNLVPNVDGNSTTSNGSTVDSRSWIQSGTTRRQVLLLILTILSVIPVYLYGPGFSDNPVVKFLVSDGYVLYPLLLWLPTFLIGFLWGKIGWQNVAWKALGLFVLLTGSTLLINPPSSFALSANEFPIRPYYLWVSFLSLALFTLGFGWLTRRENKLVQKTITLLAWLGDKSLFIYIVHWIVIDLTLWAFAPQWWVIWITILVFLVLYHLYSKRQSSAS